MLSPDLQFFKLSNFIIQSGIVVPELTLAYRCYGKLNEEKDNVIVLPTYYAGTDLSYVSDNGSWVGPGKALDSNQYFIVIPNLFGNSVSSSPSNMSPPFNGGNFPKISLFDNIKAQFFLLDSLGVKSIELVLGWSMGAMQSYQWCAQYPDMVKRALIICGSAKTSLHNQVFLSGVRSCLEADSHFNNGDYLQAPNRGLKTFGRVYAGWAYSQAFFRNHRYREMGFQTVDELLTAWEQDHLAWDANDLLTMLDTWMTADISQQEVFEGDLATALGHINAVVWLMPCEQDLYFRYEDNIDELRQLKKAHYCGFESDFGHCAPAPGRFKKESALVESTIKQILCSETLNTNTRA